MFGAVGEANKCRNCDSKDEATLLEICVIIGLSPKTYLSVLLAEELVKISPDLDMDSVCDDLVLLDPPWTANSNAAQYSTARYTVTGQLTPALISYI